MKRFVVFSLVLVTALSPVQFCVGASNGPPSPQPIYFTSAGGRGYTEARRAPSTAAALGLTIIAIAAVVAVGLYKQGHIHSHSH